MRKILVVEDEQDLRDTYDLILSTEPYVVSTATNGKIALELCAQKTFDLILLDLMMPVMNGVQFLEKFKMADHLDTKIVIISNLSNGDMLTQALKHGAVKSVVKADLTPKQLINLVRYEFSAG